MLDLPVRAGTTVLGVWIEQAARVAEALEIAQCPVRVVLNKAARTPESAGAAGRPGSVKLTVEFDREEFRGTGGVLRDLSQDYAAEDLILVCNANQVVLDDLAALLAELVAEPSDVGVLATEDGTPLGIKLFRAGAFRGIKPKGFVDLNEQALPALAQTHDVRVVTTALTRVFPVRVLDDYMNALHAVNAPHAEVQVNSLAEDWFESFRLVEDGAEIGAGARVHDSVVLRGGRVGADAVLVRSLVCDGASVGRGEVISDEVVSTASPRAREGAR